MVAAAIRLIKTYRHKMHPQSGAGKTKALQQHMGNAPGKRCRKQSDKPAPGTGSTNDQLPATKATGS